MTVQAIGWLEDRVPTTGEVPAPCIDRLFEAYESEKFVSDGGLGPHCCEICIREHGGPERVFANGEIFMRLLCPVIQWRGKTLRLYGHGHHLIRLENRVFACPLLILHYVLDHRYRPPTEFLDAVETGRFIVEEDLIGER